MINLQNALNYFLIQIILNNHPDNIYTINQYNLSQYFFSSLKIAKIARPARNLVTLIKSHYLSCAHSFPGKSISASRTRTRVIFKSLSAFVSKLNRNLSRYFSTSVATSNAIYFGTVSAYLLSHFS